MPITTLGVCGFFGHVLKWILKKKILKGVIMEYKLNSMCEWERKKAVYLMSVAQSLGISLEDYGEVAVNQNSGYTYLWSEMYNFCLYMPIGCELQKSDVYVSWTNSENGEERETKLNNMTLKDIEEWTETQEKSITCTN